MCCAYSLKNFEPTQTLTKITSTLNKLRHNSQISKMSNHSIYRIPTKTTYIVFCNYFESSDIKGKNILECKTEQWKCPKLSVNYNNKNNCCTTKMDIEQIHHDILTEVN